MRIAVSAGTYVRLSRYRSAHKKKQTDEKISSLCYWSHRIRRMIARAENLAIRSRDEECKSCTRSLPFGMFSSPCVVGQAESIETCLPFREMVKRIMLVLASISPDQCEIESGIVSSSLISMARLPNLRMIS